MLRFVAAVMTTSGLLLLADAGATLVWQEPVSALIALRQQSQLDSQLGAQPALAAEGELSQEELDRLARRHDRRTAKGQAWGRIDMPTLGRDYVVVEGTDEGSLRKGPGHYTETALPGQGRTVAIAGHRTTYLAPFREIDQLEEGDKITVEMPWARFTYTVEGQKIVEPTRTSVIRDVRHERLVLTACHPLYSAAQRIVVFAELEGVVPV